MSDVDILPELKEIIGAMLFVARQPLTLADLKRVMGQVAETQGGITKDYAKASEADLGAALQQLKVDLIEKRVGLEINEVANGFRMENNALCGPWLRHLLEKGRPSRLSRPALETLAIIAYRQPCTRADIEKVRGVAVDQIIRNLLEMQLIRITGRSELPGRPWLFGTTQRFLEHFGLRDVDDLPSVQELRRLETEQIRKSAPAEAPAGESPEGAPAAEAAPEESSADGMPPEEEDEEEFEEEDEEEYEDEEDDDEEEEGEAP
ncbi:MAG: SMC-Scp complex subunit ScpB [Kiritimatiellae bacterium]|nr:SMC-Scp complex subunit ScpB [Kiritimatiellia bacterium]